MAWPAIVAVVASSIPWTEVIKAAPKLAEVGAKIYETARGTQRNRQARNNNVTTNGGTSDKEFSALQDRLDALEDNGEAQAEIIAQMARHQAALVRWVIVLGLSSIVTGAIAVTALVIAVLA